jgi:hypothetical protein
MNTENKKPSRKSVLGFLVFAALFNGVIYALCWHTAQFLFNEVVGCWSVGWHWLAVWFGFLLLTPVIATYGVWQHEFCKKG